MADLSELIDFVWSPPRRVPGVKRPVLDKTLAENFKYIKYWGFTIYRTYYGPASDEHWETLLVILKQQIRLALGYYETQTARENDERRKYGRYRNEADYDRELRIMKDLFRLFPREDPSLLSGLSIEGIRRICIQEHSEAEARMAGAHFNFVLVADEAVLKDIAHEKFVVKAVGHDWDKTRGGWGWIRMSTGSLLDLWQTLLESSLLDIGKYYMMKFEGPEDGLESHLWEGNLGMPSFEDYTEVQTAQGEVRELGFKFD